MDCEKFDRVVLDLLYDELDEITRASATRHMDHCARCAPIAKRLRATREVGALRLLEAPAGLEERIVEAERRIRAHLPLRKRLGRGFSVLAAYTMRPQLAMGAVLVLMVGVSLLMLRVRPSNRQAELTERGVPELPSDPLPDTIEEKSPGSDAVRGVAQAHGPVDEGSSRERPRAERDRDSPLGTAPTTTPVLPAPSPGTTADAGDLLSSAQVELAIGHFARAQQLAEEAATRDGHSAGPADLLRVQAEEQLNGCSKAANEYERIASRHHHTPIEHRALWEAARCYRENDDLQGARRVLVKLLDVPEYADKAQNAIDALPETGPGPSLLSAAPREPSAKPSPAGVNRQQSPDDPRRDATPQNSPPRREAGASPASR